MTMELTILRSSTFSQNRDTRRDEKRYFAVRRIVENALQAVASEIEARNCRVEAALYATATLVENSTPYCERSPEIEQSIEDVEAIAMVGMKRLKQLASQRDTYQEILESLVKIKPDA